VIPKTRNETIAQQSGKYFDMKNEAFETLAERAMNSA
jgi:hypothetical protein